MFYLIKKKNLKLLLITLILFISAITLTFVFKSLKQFQLGSQLANSNHIAYLSHQLIKQHTQIFSVLIEKNSDINEVNTILENLTSQDFIDSATLYQVNGEILAKSGTIVDKISPEESDESNNTDIQNIVEPIYSSQKTPIGFLRVAFKNKHQQQTEQILSTLFHRLYAQIIITLLCGLILGIVFFILFSKKKHASNNSTKKLTKSLSYSPAKHFHQRRKRR